MLTALDAPGRHEDPIDQNWTVYSLPPLALHLPSPRLPWVELIKKHRIDVRRSLSN